LPRCAAFAFIGLMAACSGPQQSAPPAPAVDAAAQREAAAAKDLAMYEQLRQLGNLELAAPIGRQLLQKYPGTQAAAQVQASIGEVEASAKSSGEKRRLAALWLYQSGTMDGGAQNTATIAPTVPAGNPIRLILRKHADWGRSVYLYGVEPGFTCAADCRVSVKFDDAPPQKLRASLPPTGEPAMFVEDDEIFLTKMAKAKDVAIEATPKGKAPVSLRFEVGGYDAAKWPDVAKSAKASKSTKKK
jgi:hypothetical protein